MQGERKSKFICIFLLTQRRLRSQQATNHIKFIASQLFDNEKPHIKVFGHFSFLRETAESLQLIIYHPYSDHAYSFAASSTA